MEDREKVRLDILISEKENIPRAVAKSFIEEGLVSVNQKTITSPGVKFDMNEEITVNKPNDMFVSRAGNKLKAAIEAFSIDVNGKICIDVGASTGGFTDCLLKYGASKVYAIDTGTDQLHNKLKEHPKVISIEKTNINNVHELPDKAEILVIDVSFVSLKKVFDSALNLTLESAEIICLIKPQFEVGRENISKKGIVRDKKNHTKILNDFRKYFTDKNLSIQGLIESPIKGLNGNTEHLIFLKRKF